MCDINSKLSGADLGHLAYVIKTLRETGNFQDEEGETTSNLEAILQTIRELKEVVEYPFVSHTGMRYPSPDACGEVVAIVLAGRRFKLECYDWIETDEQKPHIDVADENNQVWVYDAKADKPVFKTHYSQAFRYEYWMTPTAPKPPKVDL